MWSRNVTSTKNVRNKNFYKIMFFATIGILFLTLIR